MSGMRTRFAPSPTGRLHLGHVLAARVAWALARHGGGEFLLRYEDIDVTRVRPEYATLIEEDLRWLGLHWDGGPLWQRTRGAAYQAALDQLRDAGCIYPCFCTRGDIQHELEQMAAAPHGPEGPLYPGTCRRLPASQAAEKIAAGAAHAWRLDARAAAAAAGPLHFHDLRFGTIAADPMLLGDIVLARKDIGVSYHLAVVVDDAFQEITHVTRGEDLLPATHAHRLLQKLLGLPQPCYLHHPLVRDEQGRRLAKRHDSLAVTTLREQGLAPAAVLARTDPEFAECLSGFPPRCPAA